MPTLFDKSCQDQFLARIERLRPDSAREWGKMDAAQALAHCALLLETATGDAKPPRPLLARMLGRMFKGWAVGDMPFAKGSPRRPSPALASTIDFERERERMVAALRKFHNLGPTSAARYEHTFLGKLTGDEWGRIQHKHIDHHLRQFGV